MATCTTESKRNKALAGDRRRQRAAWFCHLSEVATVVGYTVCREMAFGYGKVRENVSVICKYTVPAPVAAGFAARVTTRCASSDAGTAGACGPLPPWKTRYGLSRWIVLRA